jgi:hypothetical protein
MEIDAILELREEYKKFDDESLFKVVRNARNEYLPEAREAAADELRNRGIREIPKPESAGPDDGESNGTPAVGFQPVGFQHMHGLAWEAAGNSAVFMENTHRTPLGTLVEIPGFKPEEVAQLIPLFEENRIQFEIQPATHSEYLFLVPQAQLSPAVRLVKEFLCVGLGGDSPEKFSGDCPGCGTPLRDADACGGCGLRLTGDLTEALRDHPFVAFLRRNHLL